MVRINWTFQAIDDLQNIAEYISKSSEKYARLQVTRLRQRTKILTSQSYSGKIVPEIEKQNVRELLEGNYRIIYQILNDERIDILAIHHTSRDLTKRKI